MLALGDICFQCKQPALYELEPECRACHQPPSLRSPNVLLANKLKDALRQRFKERVTSCKSRSPKRTLEELRKLGSHTKAVASVPTSFAERFLSDPTLSYASYHHQTEAGVRSIAPLSDDRRRAIVDAFGYGTYGRHITFAVLSMDGKGLSAWGDVYMELIPEAIAHRATVVENNSFHLATDRALRQIMSKSSEPLEGKISTWGSRGDLVAIKLAHVQPGTPAAARITSSLLRQGTSRETANFCEVHIYSGFNCQAVTTVRNAAKSSRHPYNQLFVDCIKTGQKKRSA